MKEGLPTATSKQMMAGFFVQLVLNSLVIVVANMMFPRAVVLGTASFSYWWAVFHSMLIFSLLGTLAIPMFENWQRMKGKALTSMNWMMGYLVINFAGLWVITRFSEQFGLGIAAWWIVLILALVFDFFQGMGMMLVFPKPVKS